MVTAKNDLPVPRILLSSALRKFPAALTKDGQLNLVNKDISKIGEDLPKQLIQSVTKLYLSGNYISSLYSIDIFKNLRVLSLKNNEIRYFEELQSLSLLSKLEVLSLEGNSVTKLPHYRVHVLTLCTVLTQLDGLAVTDSERSCNASRVHKIFAVYSKLRENELRNAVLVHISIMAACNIELRRVILGKFR